jgi:hypothetical protein
MHDRNPSVRFVEIADVGQQHPDGGRGRSRRRIRPVLGRHRLTGAGEISAVDPS